MAIDQIVKARGFHFTLILLLLSHWNYVLSFKIKDWCIKNMLFFSPSYKQITANTRRQNAVSLHWQSWQYSLPRSAYNQNSRSILWGSDGTRLLRKAHARKHPDMLCTIRDFHSKRYLPRPAVMWFVHGTEFVWKEQLSRSWEKVSISVILLHWTF